jgi:23S rRNA (adenine2030-N6)-methyltransferase
MDAFHAIESLCPPQEKRGIVLIDPSYELKADYQRVVAATQHVIKHWRNGMLMLWYPILHANYHTQMKADICAIANRGECVISEIIYQQSALRMLGSGMLVLNPPYQLQSNSSAALDFFNQCLPQTARFSHTIQTY